MRILLDSVLNCPVSMKNRRVIAASEGTTDGLEALGCELPSKVHTDMARVSDRFGSLFPQQIGDFEVETFRNDLEERGDPNLGFR